MKKSSLPSDSVNLLLFGIVSLEKDYRLVYFINKMTGMELKKNDDLLKTSIQNQQIEASYFAFSDFDYDYYLISNKQNGICMVEKFKNINYWLILKLKAIEMKLPDLENKINSIPFVLGCFKISDQKTQDTLSDLLIT
ncbi:MAG: IPExxxVDY family protein [Bacteroidetes bacterium]|nr:IPExxxVDY family protein [Bacteroidota bacterium]MBL6962346.1 IPExxxVDY family protein [Bacteroidota bacterium]